MSKIYHNIPQFVSSSVWFASSLHLFWSLKVSLLILFKQVT
jgi:hypothetical protein